MQQDFGRRREFYVAIGKYDSGSIPDIACCEEDVSALSAAMAAIRPLGGHAPEVIVRSTRDGREYTEKGAILHSIEEFGDKVEVEDTAFIVFSCHGASLDRETYLIPSDGDPSDPATWIALAEIKVLLDSWDCRFKVILLDACHSGEAGLSFKHSLPDFEPNKAAALLLSHSRGIIFAAACAHQQLALVRPDGIRSVWIGSIIDVLTQETASPKTLLTYVEVLDRAASQTAYEADALGRPQTPYMAIKADGIIPLGQRKTSGLSREDPRATPRHHLRDVLCLVLEVKIKAGFGHNMRIRSEREMQKRFATEGFLHTRVFSFEVGGTNAKIAVMFDLLDGDVNAALLTRIENISSRSSLARYVLLIRSEPWGAHLLECAEVCHHISLFTIPVIERPLESYLSGGFVCLSEMDSLILFRANEIVAWLEKQLGKVFHVMLSDQAASSYDKDYGKTSFATMSAMEAEERTLAECVRTIKGRGLAVDVGCGTGRHSRFLAKNFARVIGYDFSAKMIHEARSNLDLASNSKWRNKVDFSIRDVESNPISLPTGSVDLFVASFGMGSFVEGLTHFLANLKNQLACEGRLIISFYNKDAMIYKNPPPWRDTSLSAVIDLARDELEVTLPSGDHFRIFCRAYSVNEIKATLAGIFDKVTIATCSTLASFLPSAFFTGVAGADARLVIASIDAELENFETLPFGTYITAICEKSVKTAISLITEDNVIKELALRSIPYEVFKHKAANTSVEIAKQLSLTGGEVAKVILLTHELNPKDHKSLVLCVIPSNARLDLEKVKKVLPHKVKRLWFAAQRDVKERFGLEVGCLPPVGYESPISMFVDHSIAETVRIYCGSTNPERSICLSGSSLAGLSAHPVCDITTDGYKRHIGLVE